MLTLHMRNVLFHQISPEMQQRLGVIATPVPDAPDKRLVYDLRAVACVRRQFKEMLTRIDPSVRPKNRRMG